jgi:hypothetical protein
MDKGYYLFFLLALLAEIIGTISILQTIQYFRA